MIEGLKKDESVVAGDQVVQSEGKDIDPDILDLLAPGKGIEGVEGQTVIHDFVGEGISLRGDAQSVKPGRAPDERSGG